MVFYKWIDFEKVLKLHIAKSLQEGFVPSSIMICQTALTRFGRKQGLTRHRPIAHPVVFRYLSYSTTFAEYGPVHRLRRCPAFGRAGTCLFTMFTEYGHVHRLRLGWDMFVHPVCRIWTRSSPAAGLGHVCSRLFS